MPISPASSLGQFATLAQAKKTRNVLNTQEVLDFLSTINAKAFGHLGGPDQMPRQQALSEWMNTSARKWLLREGAARPAQALDVRQAGSPAWAVSAQKERDGLWMVKLGERQRGQLAHLADWLLSEAPLRQINKLSFASALDKTVEWDAARARQAIKLGPDQPDDPSGVEELAVIDAPEGVEALKGARWVRLHSAAALDREGSMMRHCVGGYAEQVKENNCEIFSLRDARNRPIATLEVRSIEQEDLLNLATREAWGEARMKAASTLTGGRQIVQARGPANTALPEVASLALGHLLDALSERQEAPIIAMQETGEGGLVPHPENLSFLRWPQVQAGSTLPGRCVWSPEMGALPEGLTLDVLEVRQVKAETHLPTSLKVRSLVLHPSVKSLDARGWDVENVWIQRSGPFVKRSGAQLRLGRVRELAMEPPALQNKGQHLADELVDPTLPAPFALIEAQPERALLGGLRTRELHLQGVKTLDLTGGWIERTSVVQLQDAASLNLSAVLGSQLSFQSAPDQQPSWVKMDAAQLPEQSVVGQWAQRLSPQTLDMDIDRARDMQHTQSLSAVAWRPDQGRHTELLLDGVGSTWPHWTQLLDGMWEQEVGVDTVIEQKTIKEMLPSLALSTLSDVQRETWTQAQLKTYKSNKDKEGKAFLQKALNSPSALLWAQLVDGVSKNGFDCVEFVAEQSDRVHMCPVGAYLGVVGSTPALLDRLLAGNALQESAQAREQWKRVQSAPLSELPELAAQTSWLSPETLANARNRDPQAMEALGVAPATAAELKASEQQESLLDAKLPFSEDGVAIEPQTEALDGWTDKRIERAKDLGVWAVQASAVLKVLDEQAPMAALLPEVIQAIEMQPASSIGSRHVSLGLMVALESPLSQDTRCRIESYMVKQSSGKRSKEVETAALQEVFMWRKEIDSKALGEFYCPAFIHKIDETSALKKWTLALAERLKIDWAQGADNDPEALGALAPSQVGPGALGVASEKGDGRFIDSGSPLATPIEPVFFGPAANSTSEQRMEWAANMLSDPIPALKKSIAERTLIEEMRAAMQGEDITPVKRWLTPGFAYGLCSAAMQSRWGVFDAFLGGLEAMKGARQSDMQTVRQDILHRVGAHEYPGRWDSMIAGLLPALRPAPDRTKRAPR